MVKCPECEFENIEGSKFCSECGNNLIEGVVNKNKKMHFLWFLAGITIPLIGILGGLYYWDKGYKNASKVLAVSITFAVVNWVVIMVSGWY